MLDHHSQRGDTIIEVMIAFTLFSMIAVGAMAIMNSGMNSAQRALEITLIRQQIDAQAEGLRYFQQSAAAASTANDATAQWQILRSLRQNDNPSEFGLSDGTNQCPAIPDTAFIVDLASMKVKDQSSIKPFDATSPAYAQVRYTGDLENRTFDAAYGIWIEAVEVGSNATDFHIRACSPTVGNGVPLTTGTIVRLYGN